MTNNDKQRVTLFLNPKLLKRTKVQAIVIGLEFFNI